MGDFWFIVAQIVVLIVGVVVGYVVATLRGRNALQEAQEITKRAETEAESRRREAELEAEREMLRLRKEFEQESKQRRSELQRLEDRLSQKEENVERKADLLERRVEELDGRDRALRADADRLRTKEDELEALRTERLAELERVAGMTRDEARNQLLDQLAESMEVEQAALIRRFQDEGRDRLEREAQEVMVTAMQRYASDCAYERTTSTIPLPNDEMKGRIIGREGRNIRAIEAATGANVLIDDTPEAVVVSCFDPVRREVARIAMERLVADGRIHPSRIEEMVGKVNKEVEADVLKAGREAVEEVGVTRLRQNIVSLIGRLKYRYSYSQNVLRHSVEVASMMGVIAAQLGLDERKARRAGLLHDIGKAVDHEVEGSHATIGADLLKRAGESDDVVNAVGAHHEDMEKTSLMAILVEICDTLSASRPGARSETTELYLKRLENLEAIGRSFEGVETCYAIQAGRELRVIARPDDVSEDGALAMAREMAERIEKEMHYPGQIRVSVIRETRAIEYAK